ncbi:FHA domain-containing protein (plasmid) [Deinococcus psychrotolerans]|uniref:FHA domain-containing protein n=1 Tax=Deinococcus psychrotolerans TaxID=2489213 RepID=A0A3G8YTC9_9DEIO|nr:FHA domain-containing serine/threonine-protein kinase [Deinococcus psychrotolerans]AZI44506.1 FHA domain-containing protein [Deinococcus psychrotolerans]
MTATGTIFEGYRLLRPLGKGWLGEVYAAQNLDGASISALRIIAPELSAQPKVITNFRRLHQKWRQLSHPNILGVSEILERDQHVYYGMNLAQKGSLRQLLQAQGQSGQFMDLLVVVDLVRQAAGALAYAHDANLMHGDLKPENLLLNPARAIMGRPAYSVLVADFGVGELQNYTHGVHDRLIVTSPAYMSPEQCRGVRTEVRSDIYALGVILYELLTNLVPFEARDLAEAVEKHQHVAPIPPGQIRVDIPQDLEELVLTCLAKAPEYRYRTAQELEDALQGVLNQLIPQGPRPTMVLPDVPEPPAPRIEAMRDRTPFPRVQIVGDDGQLLRVEPLRASIITVGRASTNAIVLEHVGVSRHHLNIEVDDDGVFVSDLASTNGTTLGGAALAPRTRTLWPDGGMLRVEPFWLRLQPPQKVVQQARIGVQVQDNDIELTPGTVTVLKVELANTGRTVDHFQMGVEGVPPEWVQNLYHEIQLNPGMTASTSLRILVPRESQYPADLYAVQVVARSRENPAEFGYAPMNWKVLPFTETQIEVTPRRRSAWRHTHYDLKLINASNVAITYNMTVRDEEGQIHLQSPLESLRLPTGGDLRNIIPVRTIIYNNMMRLREGIGKVKIEALPQGVEVLPGASFEHRVQIKLPIRWIATSRQRTLKLHPQPNIGRDHPENISLLHLPVIPLWALPLMLIFGILFALWLLQTPSVVSVTVVPVDPKVGGAAQNPNQPKTTSQQPRTGQPFYLDFETRNATRIVVKPWNKTLFRGTGRLLIPEGVKEQTNAQITVYGRINSTSTSVLVSPTLPTPTINVFTVSAENVSSGQEVTLRWNVSNGKDVTISSLGTVPAKGEKQIKVTQNTDFTLTAKASNGGEDISKTVNVKVLEANIDSFEVTPTQAKVGDTVKLSWKVRNASSVSIDQIGTVPAQGSADYTVQGDQAFVLRAKVGDQELSKTVNLKVLAPNLETFTINPPNPRVGDTVTVTWRVNNASKITLDPFGPVESNGQRQVVINGNTIFHLSASNGQNLTDLGTFPVTPGVKTPNLTIFSASPRKPRVGQPVTLTWVSENADTAELSGIPGQGTLALPASGSTTITAPANDISLTITVKSGGGSQARMLALPVLPAAPTPAAPQPKPTPQSSVSVAGPITVPKPVTSPQPTTSQPSTPTPQPAAPTPVPDKQPTAAPPPSPQVINFTARPSSVRSGQPVTLTWATKNAALIKIFPGGQRLDASGSLVVTPSANTVYTLLADGVRGRANVQVTPNPQTPITPVVVPKPSPAVPAAPSPKITAFKVEPGVIQLGQSVTITWDTQNAKSVKLFPGGVALDSSGKLTLKPKASVMYSLVADRLRKLGGVTVTAPAAPKPSASAPAPVPTPTRPNPVPTPSASPSPQPGSAGRIRGQVIEFTAEPSTVTPGQPVTLTWRTKDAKSVRLFPYAGTRGRAMQESGTLIVKPTATTIYTLLADSSNFKVKVIVEGSNAPSTPAPEPAPPANTPNNSLEINDFSVTPKQVSAGESVVIRWDVSGADQVVIAGLGSQPQPAKGEATRVAKSSTIFSLRATAGDKIIRKIQTVQVMAANTASASAETNTETSTLSGTSQDGP